MKFTLSLFKLIIKYKSNILNKKDDFLNFD